MMIFAIVLCRLGGINSTYCKSTLTNTEWQELLEFIHKSDFDSQCCVQHPLAQQLLKFYTNHRRAIIDEKSELYRLKQEYDKKPIHTLRRT